MTLPFLNNIFEIDLISMPILLNTTSNVFSKFLKSLTSS